MGRRCALEVPPVPFAADLSAVGDLRFSEWSAREDHTNLLVMRSDYRQPLARSQAPYRVGRKSSLATV